VGIAHRLDPDVAVVTLVGSSVHETAAEGMTELGENGVMSTLIGSNEQSVSFSVDPEQIEEAVRFLHTRLFQMEAST
jgi:aspartokinase